MSLAIYILRNYMATLPKTVIESAKIDGASHFQTFFRLMLPMSVPALASFAIFQFLWVWNDLLVALVFIGPGENEPLTVALDQLLGQQGQGWSCSPRRALHDDRADHGVPRPAAVLRPRPDRRRGQGLSDPDRTGGRSGRDVDRATGRDTGGPSRARVYEHGWQSWSPTLAYRLDERPFRPVSEQRRVGNYRPDRTAPADVFRGEGLLAVDPGTGDGRARLRRRAPPRGRSRRSAPRSTATTWSCLGPTRRHVTRRSTEAGYGRLDGALARWADGFAAASGVRPSGRRRRCGAPGTTTSAASPRPTSTRTCARSTTSTCAVDVVQIDDGYQAEIGDWLALSDRFRSLRRHRRTRSARAGRRAGIWVAPFLVGEPVELAARAPRLAGRRPDGPPARRHDWDQHLYALDATHPGAEAYLPEVFGTLRATWGSTTSRSTSSTRAPWTAAGRPGVAGAGRLPRAACALIREAIGPDAYLLGCGAPILPSVGLVDAMRVGPDIAHHFEPRGRRPVPALQRAAAQNSARRAWQQGRFWVNDADCLVAAPDVERREEWAERSSGTAGCAPAATGCATSTSGVCRRPAGCCAPG